MNQKRQIHKPPLTQLELNKLIASELVKMHKELKSFNSFKNKFVGGIFTGLGTVVGATVVVSIILFILSQLSGIGVLKPWTEGLRSLLTPVEVKQDK